MSSNITQANDNSVSVNDTQVNKINNLIERANVLLNNNMLPAAYMKGFKQSGASKITIETVAKVLELGERLGMSDLAAIDSIDIIQGQLAIKNKIVPGLLSKAGIEIEIIKDYEPEYKYKYLVKKDSDGNPEYNEDGQMIYLNDPFGKPIIVDQKETDRVTTLRFHKYTLTHGIISTDVSFRLSYAKKAGWINKSTWVTLAPYMMLARAVSRGGRVVMGGMYDNYEVSDFTGQNLNVDEDGNVSFDFAEDEK